MAVVVRPSAVPKPELVMTQTHADVTRDLVATLEKPSTGYVVLLLGAVALFLVGLLTFLILVKDGLGHAGYTPPIFWSAIRLRAATCRWSSVLMGPCCAILRKPRWRWRWA